MGETVNRISNIAAEWQRHIVWIRMNVGYIKAELAYWLAQGQEISGIKTLLESFDSAFELFCRNELEVFVAARLSETGEKENNTLIGCLLRTSASFSAWLHEYEDVIKVQEGADSGGPLTLLHSCGGELLSVHSRFVNVIDTYVAEIERNTSQGNNAGAGPILEASFTCCLCDKSAGSVQLIGTPEKAEIRRDSFTSLLTSPVEPKQFKQVHDALTKYDAGALYALDLEYTPFYCPECSACYCGEHWNRWDVFDEDYPSWRDSVRGKCPKGHERMHPLPRHQ